MKYVYPNPEGSSELITIEEMAGLKRDKMSEGQRAWWALLAVLSERFGLPEPDRGARNVFFK